VALITLVAIVLLSHRRAPTSSKLYILCAAAGGFLASGLITYNYYMNRLLIGELLLLTPIVGVTWCEMAGRRSRVLRVLLVGILLLSIAWGAIVLLFNSTNRLVPPTFAPVNVGNRNLGYWNTSYDDLRFRILTPGFEKPFKRLAGAIKASGVTRVGIDVRAPVEQFPIYPLLSLISNQQVTYTGDTLFSGKIPDRTQEPQVIVEIVEADQYPRVLGDGRPRGQMLLPPQRGMNDVMLLYLAR